MSGKLNVAVDAEKFRRLLHVFVAASGEIDEDDFFAIELLRNFSDVGDGVACT